MPFSRAARSRQSGFGLIEVLVALLVLSVGVLGYAGLQMRAIQTSGDSYYRTQALAIAQDLAERVHTNSAQFTAYTNAANWSSTTTPTDCIANNCSNAANMVAFDIANMKTYAQNLLPQGLVNMETCPGTTSNLGCIYVSWDGVQPTGGTNGQCVDANGRYRNPPANLPALTCVMLEVM